MDVTEDEVNKELEKKGFSSFISELGSQAALEEYFGKSILDIKSEFYDVIYSQLLSQRIIYYNFFSKNYTRRSKVIL